MTTMAQVVERGQGQDDTDTDIIIPGDIAVEIRGKRKGNYKEGAMKANDTRCWIRAIQAAEIVIRELGVTVDPYKRSEVIWELCKSFRPE